MPLKDNQSSYYMKNMEAVATDEDNEVTDSRNIIIVQESRSSEEQSSHQEENCCKRSHVWLVVLTIGLIVIAGLVLWKQHQVKDEQKDKQMNELSIQLITVQQMNRVNNQQRNQKTKQFEQVINLKNRQILNLQNQIKQYAAKQKIQPQQHKTDPTKKKDPPKQQLIPQQQRKTNEINGSAVVIAYRSQKGGMKPQASGTTQAITFLSRNSKNQKFEQFVYKDQHVRDLRQSTHRDRIKLIQQFQNQESLNQIRFNMKLNNDDDQLEARQLQEQYLKISKRHNLAKFTEELPMCIITPSYKNNANFRIQYNLNSIFTQNYSNYFAVIINDNSPDGSDQIYRKYFEFYNISSDKYIYISNTEKKGAMENDYNANHKYCSQDAISVHLDGDDQFIGRNVLKIFNAQYQRLKAGALYSNFYFYRMNSYIRPGFTSQISQGNKINNNYRTIPMQYSHLKTYRTELFRKIDKSNFFDSTGKFFMTTSDVAFYIPVMQLSCQRVHKIPGIHYLYHTGTGNNDDTISRTNQMQKQMEVRAKPKLACDQQFKKKMEGMP